MEVVEFSDKHDEAWDELVAQAPMGTFLHTRRFLSYHGDRFSDASLLLTERDTVRAVLPAALDPADPSRVVSHPGATYGGLVHDGRLGGERALETLGAICDHYAGRGLAALRYRAVPRVYHRSPSDDDVWALSELGARRVDWQLSCAIDLAARRTPSTRRSRSLAKARARGVEVVESQESLAPLWAVLETTLKRRYGATPVHTLAEMELLRARFPDSIRPVTAVLDGAVVAGAVLFCTPAVVHTQYLATSPDGARVNALDAVVEHSIHAAAEAGARYFDFGISPGPNRRGLSPGLYRWKAEFGGGGVLHEHFEQVL
jgi:hypothetical protein